MMVGGKLFLLLFCLLFCCFSWCNVLARDPAAPAPSPGFYESPQAATEIPASVFCDSGDQNFLLLLKQGFVDGDAKLDKWNNGSSCCGWPGVVCNGSRVKYVRLAGYHLEGSIDGNELVWANLSGLEWLDLSGNGLLGSVPGDLWQLSSLQVLDLSRNNFSEGLQVLANCSGLLELNVSRNNFSGRVPLKFASSGLRKLDLSHNFLSDPWSGLLDLGRLEVVNVSHNALTGFLPLFNNCDSLVGVDLSTNGFTGGFDPDICKLKPNLHVLNVSNNDLSGSLPSSIWQCSSLEVLDLGWNFLYGAIPETLFNMANLTYLCISNNQISGQLGPTVANLKTMKQLLLINNSLAGFIPEEIGALEKLERLDLSTNGLTGGIPSTLSNCTNLVTLNLRLNLLTGNISLDFQKLPNLTNLDLSFNNLSGVIPDSIALCSGLQSIVLGRNNLTGRIPPVLGALKNLTTLSLSSNDLTGGIPAELDGCTGLVSLLLTKNPSLSGEIPANMSPFPNLQLLAVGFCGLEGEIPDWIGNCSKLQLLDLSWNHFTGLLPKWIGDLRHLIYLELSNNTLTGPIPGHLTQAPSFRGEKMTVTNMIEVTSLVLFVKKNASALPQRYTKLSSFPPSLILAYNRFYGIIPPELGYLQRVMALDLSHNSLSGPIPETLSNMSNNKLSGPIPEGGQFSTFGNDSYLGNPLLCGSPLVTKCPDILASPLLSPSLSEGGEKFNKRAFLGLTLGVGLGLAVLLVLLTIWFLSRQHRGLRRGYEETESMDGVVSFSVDLYLNEQFSKLSPADLVKATNNFDQSNIIGCGGFGLVFRATLSDGTHVAIKRLTSDAGEAEREVKAELLTLGQIQHKNLVALQGYCRFGSDQLLIYNYMENGSLDFWLHEKSDGGLKLDWPMRRRIAQGAARGLAYLHQMCEPHIVHRDIKSSNILLNEKFEAHLADFGLARHLANTDTHVTTELVGTLGYIPPEYGQAWIATLRGDVYSFGVVVLELLTRRRPVEVRPKNGVTDLVSWVLELKNRGEAEEAFDVLLRHQGYASEMLQVLDIATTCVNPIPQQRPTIQEVVSRLEQVGMEVSEKDDSNHVGSLLFT